MANHIFGKTSSELLIEAREKKGASLYGDYVAVTITVIMAITLLMNMKWMFDFLLPIMRPGMDLAATLVEGASLENLNGYAYAMATLFATCLLVMAIVGGSLELIARGAIKATRFFVATVQGRE